MKPFREITAPQKRQEAVRWLLVLPAAWLADSLIQSVVLSVLPPAGAGASPLSRQVVGLVLFYFVKEAAFVLVGALVAPRWRRATACVLAAGAVSVSLLIHLGAQYLSGSRVGLANYQHFTSEALGALVGCGVAVWLARGRPAAGDEELSPPPAE